MHIILDANIIIADYSLSGTAFRVALDGIHRTDSQLYVPELVVAEVVAKYREDLGDAASQLRKATSSLRRLRQAPFVERIGELDIDAEAQRFSEQLVEDLLAKGARLLPWPSVSHEGVVGRILSGKRPTRKDVGYRDALIWESVLAHLTAERPAEAVFVTNNSKDFCTSDDTIHPHLVDDLIGAGLDPASLSIELSLAGLNKRVFEPTLALLDQTMTQLQQGAYPEFDRRAWLDKNAARMIDGEDLRLAAIDLPEGCGRVSLSTGTQIKALAVEDVRKLSTGELLVEVKVTMTGELIVTLDSRDADRFYEAREWLGDDYYGPGDATIFVPEQTFTATLELAVGENALSSELTAMEGDYGDWSRGS